MGIQSTQFINRKQAEEKALIKLLNDEKLVRHMKSQIITMEDKELEDFLEEEFYNYEITDNL